MNEITFNMDGPNVLGAWINPKTGDAFVARDNFIQDNQFIIVTTDNRQLNLDFISDYVKLEKKTNETDEQAIANFKKNFAPKQNNKATDIPDEIARLLEPPTQLPKQQDNSNPSDYSDLMIPEDIELFNNTKSPGMPVPQDMHTVEKIGTALQNPVPNTLSTDEGKDICEEDLLFIKRVLRTSDKPIITAGISWEHYPVKKIDILTNVLGVDIDNIVDWFIKDISIDEIRKSLKQAIVDYIEASSGGCEQPNNATNIKSHPEVKLKNTRHGRKANTN